VSDEWKSYNDSYEMYLGAKDYNAKMRAEDSLNKLIGLQDELKLL
jgi:hypothetical protein